MKKFLVAAVAALTMLVFAAVAAAALDPGVHDPGNTGCVKATMTKKKTLHLEKNCATALNAAAGAEITGVNGQTFQSAEFTLKSSTQCQGGSPRFIVVTSGVLYHARLQQRDADAERGRHRHLPLHRGDARRGRPAGCRRRPARSRSSAS